MPAILCRGDKVSEFNSVFKFIRELYHTPQDFIPLHEPRFAGNEEAYLLQCIRSGFVSSIGEFVNAFEREIAQFCGSKYAIATTNGTSALHISLHAIGVDSQCEVITQPLSFIATSNAIAYTGANPIYVDVDLDTMGLSPTALERFLKAHAIRKNGQTINKQSGKILKACVPMHTFGHPLRIQEIQSICESWDIALIEDSAESLGSYILDGDSQIHTGNFGICGILSLNGNKTITCGGGGAILTNDQSLASKLKHLTTTAKIPHPYEYDHDELGYNYRLPNLNASLALAQIEQLPTFLEDKAKVAQAYDAFFHSFEGIEFINARKGTKPNFWLNAIKFSSEQSKDAFLRQSNEKGIMTRPIWKLNNHSAMYRHCQHDGVQNAHILQKCVVNLPSSVRIDALTSKN